MLYRLHSQQHCCANLHIILTQRSNCLLEPVFKFPFLNSQFTNGCHCTFFRFHWQPTSSTNITMIVKYLEEIIRNNVTSWLNLIVEGFSPSASTQLLPSTHSLHMCLKEKPPRAKEIKKMVSLRTDFANCGTTTVALKRSMLYENISDTTSVWSTWELAAP